MFSKRKSIAIAASAAAVAALGLSIYTASASATGAPSYTCTGGSIPGGTYSSLTVKGNCNVDDGDVHVVNDVTVKPNASLWVVFAGDDLTVGGSISAGKNTNLVLGCGLPFYCYESLGEASVTVQHDIVTAGARVVFVVFSHIGGSVTQTGGGGGNDAQTCRAQNDLAVNLTFGNPVTLFRADTIGGDVTITGVHTCYIELSDNRIGQSVTYTGNKTYNSDGNDIEGNHIARNLACVGNVPPPQDFYDPNFVGGLATGQCKELAGGITTTTITGEAPRG